MPEGKYFFIKSRMHGKVLDIERAVCAPGSRVVTWPQKEASKDWDNQLWWADKAARCIRSKMDPTMVLDIKVDTNTLVVNKEKSDDTDQKWVIHGDVIKNAHNGKVLDIAGENKGNAARICAYQSNNQSNQKWEFKHVPADYFFIVSKLNEKVWDVAGADTSAGTKIIIYDKKGEKEPNQIFYENKSGVICSKLNNMAIDTMGKLGKSIRLQPFKEGHKDQMWFLLGSQIVNMQDRSTVLGIRDGATDSGAKIQAGVGGKANHEQWRYDKA